MIATLLLSALLTDGAASSVEIPEIRVVEGEVWTAGSSRDIKAVFDSTARSLLKHFPGRKLKPITVEHSKDNPIVLYQPGPNGEIQIRVTSTGLHWSQFAYQFSHEMTHVLCGYEQVAPNSAPNMWFEESLCMMGSLFTMRQMAKDWQTAPPYPNWKDYGKSLASYADEVIKRPQHQLEPGVNLAKWYQQNEEKLRAGGGADARQMQSVVANVLLPMFEAAPEHWPAVGYLNAKKTGNAASFDEYLDAWEESAPVKHRTFIRKIRLQFGMP